MADTNVTAENSNTKVGFTEQLSNELIKFKDGLPRDFNKARFIQNSVALLKDNPNLQKYGQTEVIAGLMKGAFLGLDFYNKECYLLPYGGQLNFQQDYRGSRKLAKKYTLRPIKDIYAKLIRDGDVLEEFIVNGEQSINFRPKFLNDGAILGAFAVCLYEDGGLLYEIMTLTDLENTRKQSKAPNSPAWKNFTGEMYKKTVLHRLCKSIDIDFENPTQRKLFTEEMEIETDVEKIVENEINENANQQDFEEVVVQQSGEF